MRIFKCYGNKLLLKELKGCYRFFLKEMNLNKKSIGFGLIRDKSYIHKNVASIASNGYGFAALVVGVKHKWITFDRAYYIVNKVLDTYLNNIENIHGFYYHFIDIETGKRVWNCEISIIDTAILVSGALMAGEFFGKDVKEKADKLYKNVEWNWYVNDKNEFYMGYKPEEGFWGHWDRYAEQLILYILGTASPNYAVDKSMYDLFLKKKADYAEIKDIIYTYCGTLFTYQYSHAWIDFRNKIDSNGINWFENSIKATLANRRYCIDNSNKYKTYGENSWGLTACVSPKGYISCGARPCDVDLNIENDGTVSPAGAIGSIVFTPEESIKAMEYYYNNFPKLWGKYGFKDAYNLEGSKQWFAKEYIGIDKGIELIMIENYLNETIWRYMMKNTYVQNGLDILNIKHIKERKVNEKISTN